MADDLTSFDTAQATQFDWQSDRYGKPHIRAAGGLKLLSSALSLSEEEKIVWRWPLLSLLACDTTFQR